MDSRIIKAAEACTRGSEDESSNFPAQLALLAEVGVEGYFADLRRAMRTYYLPDGEAFETPTHRLDTVVSERFDMERVEAAVRQSQAGAHTYLEFCRKIAAAGCAGYVVSLLGRRVVYFGRTGETHVELFPAPQ